jgi:saccharopepsin
VSVGNPPQIQTLRLSTDDAGILIASATCAGDFCQPRFHQFNSSLSSTYEEDGSEASYEFGGTVYSGYYSRDTLNVSGTSLDRYTFEEWTDSSCRFMFCEMEGFDGVLGLMPPWNLESLDPPGVLNAMQDQHLLDSNVVTLLLPPNYDDLGEIGFGGIEKEKIQGDLTWLPVEDLGWGVMEDQWTTSATDIFLETPSPHHFDLRSRERPGAALTTVTPFLILPEGIARTIHEAIGTDFDGSPIGVVPCEKRSELPDLTFTLSGHNFTLSAFEYTKELGPAMHGCAPMFEDATEFGIPNDAMVLGTPFFRGFYTALDFEERRIGCKFTILLS